MKVGKQTIPQRLRALPWWAKSIQFWVTGIPATYLLVVLGAGERLAGLGGLIGINLIVFITIALIADRDDAKAADRLRD